MCTGFKLLDFVRMTWYSSHWSSCSKVFPKKSRLQAESSDWQNDARLAVTWFRNKGGGSYISSISRKMQPIDNIISNCSNCNIRVTNFLKKKLIWASFLMGLYTTYRFSEKIILAWKFCAKPRSSQMLIKTVNLQLVRFYWA